MTKYARKSDGRWFDVWSVPENFPDYATLVKCLPGEPFVLVDAATENGDLVGPNDTTISQDKPQVHAQPQTLSKTAFRKYAASRLVGGGTAGMARFEVILAAARAQSPGVVTFCAGQYDAADTFDRSEVQSFADILVAATIMTKDEGAAIIAGWP